MMQQEIEQRVLAEIKERDTLAPYDSYTCFSNGQCISCWCEKDEEHSPDCIYSE